MTVRVFGPTLGAGTVIEEKQAAGQIQPSPFGTTAHAGVLEKGDIGELIEPASREDAIRQTGTLIPGTDLPDNLRQFYDLANGAGRLFLVRVTDGNEVVSSVTFYDRQTQRLPMLRVDAKNAGRWAGKRQILVFDITGTGDLTATTIDTGLTLVTDELVGGTLFSAELPGQSWEITGNTVAGVVTIQAGSTLKADWDNSGGGDLEFAVELENEDVLDRNVAVLLKRSIIDPDNEFGLEVYENGLQVRNYADLSMDPNADRYVENVINEDTGNHWIAVTDLNTGGVIAAIRPANHYGTIPTAGITATVLSLEVAATISVSSPGGADGTATTFTPGTDARSETIIVTTTAIGPAAAFTVDSDLQDHPLPAGVTATPYVAGNRWTTGFTITDGATAWGSGDTITIKFEYLRPNEAVDGFVFPDVVNFPNERFRIVSNTVSQVTVVTGSDMTVNGADGDTYRVEYRQQMEGGLDGVADLVDGDFVAVWNTDTSLFNRLFDRNLGLIKYATPGKTVTAVQQAGRAYAQAKNGQYRYEIPVNIVDEASAVDHLQNTLGRTDYAAVSFPSFGSYTNPEVAGLKEVSLTGGIHGREARTAADFLGFHKAASDIFHVLPFIRELPTGDERLNEEILNPNGLSVVKKKFGNFIIWGDRLPFLNPAFRFKHVREYLSHIERVLQENFDFIIFSINDALLRPVLLAALQGFFLPEFTKRALRGDSFEEAVTIKVDKENNPEAVIDLGEAVVDINLNIAATVEKLRMRVSKTGIFEETGV